MQSKLPGSAATTRVACLRVVQGAADLAAAVKEAIAMKETFEDIAGGLSALMPRNASWTQADLSVGLAAVFLNHTLGGIHDRPTADVHAHVPLQQAQHLLTEVHLAHTAYAVAGADNLAAARLPVQQAVHGMHVEHVHNASARLKPAHFVAIDHGRKMIRVVLRGSRELGDLFTNVAAQDAVYRHGHAHKGFLHAAKWLLLKQGARLQHLLEQHEGCAAGDETVPNLHAAAASTIGANRHAQNMPNARDAQRCVATHIWMPVCCLFRPTGAQALSSSSSAFSLESCPPGVTSVILSRYVTVMTCCRYGLRFTGHSLGGAVASVAAELLVSGQAPSPAGFAIKKISAVAIGPPPSLSEELALAAAKFATALVLDHDIVARASAAQLAQLQSEAVLQRQRLYTSMQGGANGPSALLSQLLGSFSAGADVQGRAADQAASTERSVHFGGRKQDSSCEAGTVQYHVAGRVLHLRRRQKVSGSHWWQGQGDFDLVQLAPTAAFRRIVLQSTCISDHSLSNVAKALGSVMSSASHAEL